MESEHETSTQEKPPRVKWRWRIKEWIALYADADAQTMAEIDRKTVFRALRDTEGSIPAAAALLQIDRKSIYRRLWRMAEEAAREQADQGQAS